MLELLAHVAHAVLGQLTAPHEVALILVALLAPHEEHAVEARREGITDPDRIHGAQATKRDDPKHRVVLEPHHAGHLDRRQGVVLAHEGQHPRLLLEFIGDVNRLDHLRNHVDAVVLERDDALRAGSEADPAAAAAQRIQQRRALLILVERAERTFLGAPLALRAFLQIEFRIAQIAGARMHGRSPGNRLDRLDRLESRTGAVIRARSQVHRRPDGARGIDAGAPRFVREADEVRIGEAVLQRGQIGTLAIGEVQDLRSGLGGFGLLLAVRCLSRRFALRGLRLGALGGGDVVDLRGRHHSGGQHDQVGLQLDVLTQQRLLDFDADLAVGIRRHTGDLALGQHDACVLLNVGVEALVLGRRPDVLVDHVDLGVRVLLADVHRLLQGNTAAHSGAIRQMVLVA